MFLFNTEVKNITTLLKKKGGLQHLIYMIDGNVEDNQCTIFYVRECKNLKFIKYIIDNSNILEWKYENKRIIIKRII
jgi:hypothetical protein